VLNVCLICSALLIVKVIFVITALFFLLCVSTILVNNDDHQKYLGDLLYSISVAARRRRRYLLRVSQSTDCSEMLNSAPL